MNGLKGAVTEHTETLFQLFTGALSDPETEVQSNAAYAVGLLVEYSELDLSSQYLPLLGVLRPLFDIPPDAPAVKLSARDNAAGAVARMIIRNTASVPLDQVLPLFMTAVPTQEDPMENRPIFRAVFHLFRINSQALLPYLDHLLQAFGKVLDPSGPDRIGDEIRQQLIQLISALNAENPGKIQEAGLNVWL